MVPASPPPLLLPFLISVIVNVSLSASVSSIAKSNADPFVLSIVASLFTVSVSSTATGSLSLIPVTVNESSAVEVSFPSLTV